MLVPGVMLLLNPLIFPDPGVQVQENKVPATFEIRLMAVLESLQIDLLKGVVERSGTGLTITIKFVRGPGHPLAVGVIR